MGTKWFFLISGLLLAAVSVFAVATLPGVQSDRPVIYWNTDANPARELQVELFERWLVDRGYEPVDLRVDTNNAGVMKVIIQSAAGVSSELVDIYGGGQLRQYVAAGVLLDVTDHASRYGFEPDKTYAAAHPEIVVDGRQYSFPCNVSSGPLTLNRRLLEREGLPLPKFDWTWDEFLEWALAVKKTDDRGRVVRYALMPFEPLHVWQTNGASIFNETMTRCVLDSEAALEASRFFYSLMFEHEVMPTTFVRDAMASESGYGGPMLQWIGSERVVGAKVGRFGLIQLRRFENFAPDVALVPHKVMPMQRVGARSAGISASVENPELALRFLEFLADEPYNRMIVQDSDALPPNPAAAQSPEFRNPPRFPSEHGVHEKYSRSALEHGVGSEYSPFVSPYTVGRLLERYDSGVQSRSLSIEEAMRRMTDEINREIERTIRRDEKLRARYEAALERQERIDAIKAAGEPVPAAMIDNPVLRRLREAGR